MVRVVGIKRPLSGRIIFGSSSWRASTHYGVQQKRQCASYRAQARHGAYLEYIQNKKPAPVKTGNLRGSGSFLLACLHPLRSTTKEAVCQLSGTGQTRRLPGVHPEYRTVCATVLPTKCAGFIAITPDENVRIPL
ncbi:hypothetical protein TNCV_3356771 [Trichonephila clavipes]|nr:hypothetical protein TNCV_3356771 [Trichonephila clavipes]